MEKDKQFRFRVVVKPVKFRPPQGPTTVVKRDRIVTIQREDGPKLGGYTAKFRHEDKLGGYTVKFRRED